MAFSLTLLAALAALALITDALASRRQAKARAAFPALGQILSVKGHKVHVLQQGQGPDLILIHGASGNLRDLLPLMARLAPHYRVTAFDRPGLGWSDPIPEGTSLQAQALHLSNAARQLGIENPVILGQSYGGAIALAWALCAALKPRALVLVSSPSLPWPGKLDPWYRLTNTWAGRNLLIPLVAAYLPEAYINATITGIFTPNAAPPDYLSYIGADLSLTRAALRSNTAQVNGLRDQILAQEPLYPGLALPVELIHGTADTIVPLTIHSAPLAPRLPHATLTILQDTGHMPHHAHPDVILAAIARAFAQSQLN